MPPPQQHPQQWEPAADFALLPPPLHQQLDMELVQQQRPYTSRQQQYTTAVPEHLDRQLRQMGARGVGGVVGPRHLRHFQQSSSSPRPRGIVGPPPGPSAALLSGLAIGVCVCVLLCRWHH